MQQVSGQHLGQALFELLPALPHEQGFFPLPLPRAVARQMEAAPGQFPFPVAQPAQAPPGLPPPPQPRAVSPTPPPPAPVTLIRPVHERRGM